MALAGFLLIIVGVAGALAHQVVTIGAELAGIVTGGSVVTIAIGAALVLTAMARTDAGGGVFPLAVGIGALAAQPATRWMDAPSVHAWQPWLGIGLAVLIGGGAAAVVVSLSAFDYRYATRALLLFTVSSLVADGVFDFAGWDGLMNVSTAAFASGAALGYALQATEVVEEVVGPDAHKLRNAYGPGWSHPAVSFYLLWGVRLGVAGLGLSAVTVTTMASFDLPAFGEVLLVPPAAFGAYLVVPVIGYARVVRAVTPERMVRTGLQGISDTLDDVRLWKRVGLAFCGGYLALVLLAELLLGPAVWLAAVLVIAAIATGAVAARVWLGAYHDLVGRLLLASEAPERTAPSIAELLGSLGRGDPVFRLLPGSDELAPG